jgi:hypothetical protein
MRLALAALLLLAWAPSAEARVVVERDTRGETRAELSYDRSGDQFDRSYRDFTVRIHDAGELVFERELTCGRRCSPAGFERKRSIALRDLDGGGAEVLVDLYSGGAYCCWITVVYRADGDTYVRSSKSWGPKRPRLTNLAGGHPEFISHDDRLLGPYGCASCWRYLPHVWRFDDGGFRDVTRRFPGQVGPGSKKLRRKYFHASANDGDFKPVLAAYVATRYLLGRPRGGWRLVRRALRRGELDNRRGRYDFCPCGDRYPKRLRRFLRETGYR